MPAQNADANPRRATFRQPQVWIGSEAEADGGTALQASCRAPTQTPLRRGLLLQRQGINAFDRLLSAAEADVGPPVPIAKVAAGDYLHAVVGGSGKA